MTGWRGYALMTIQSRPGLCSVKRGYVSYSPVFRSIDRQVSSCAGLVTAHVFKLFILFAKPRIIHLINRLLNNYPFKCKKTAILQNCFHVIALIKKNNAKSRSLLNSNLKSLSADIIR